MPPKIQKAARWLSLPVPGPSEASSWARCLFATLFVPYIPELVNTKNCLEYGKNFQI
jgi:hypothetical protein